VVLLPFHTEFHHPDLVGAADVVVGKLGYSTVAEVFCAGTAIAYIQRPQFPESPILAAWVEEHMAARCLSEDALLDGSWLSLIDGLVPDRGQIPPTPRGAETAARLIIEEFPAVFG
jgi:UDP-N-acetylglucosamine:LPS N-acetylglucosamine transferase